MPAKWSRKTFLFALGFFLLSRALTLSAFPIFDDEAVYIQYSQRIHDDWAQNKYISLGSNGGEWKPPLQYWLAAPFIRWGHDPLVTGRLLALVFSLCGLGGFYLFTRELFGAPEAAICAWLYVLCPPVLFHNNQFIAETFLFSTAPFVYWAILKGMRTGPWRWLWVITAILPATVLLLFKQSGFVMLGVSVFLPFARLHFEPNEGNRSPARPWRELAINLALVALVIVGAKLAVRALLPSRFDAIRDHFKTVWVLSTRELIQLPIHLWRANLSMMADYIDSYYSWFVPVFFAAFLWLALKRRNLAELALAGMNVVSGAAIIFLLRRYNEYIFNTAVIAVLLPLLARAATLIWNLPKSGPIRQVRRGLLAFVVLMLAYWSYQITLMGISPGRYVERSTPWALANYLQGWPTGFGIKEVVALLEKEKRPGVILADARWGNPFIGLQIYSDRFPNLRLLPALPKFSDPETARQLSEEARQLGPARFAIFSADQSGNRAAWQAQVERELCADRMEVKAYPTQMPIIVCRF